MYNKYQIKQLASHFKKKFLDGEAEGYEIAVALIAMVKDKRLREKDVKEILLTVHHDNPIGVMRSLERAHELIDDDMINSIIKEVKAHR